MKKHLKSYAVITLGAVIYALSFDWFVAPNHFAMGGVTGLAQILHYRCSSSAGKRSEDTCWSAACTLWW